VKETVKPWVRLYPDRVRALGAPEDIDLVSAWRRRVGTNPSGAALTYFDRVWSASELDGASDAFAVALAQLGVTKGDRVGVCLQNIPAFPVALIALWKLGAIALVINPMYRGRELRHLIDDSESIGIIHTDCDGAEIEKALAGSSIRWRISTSPLDQQGRNDPRALPDRTPYEPAPAGDFWQLIARHRGQRPEAVGLTGDDVALLAYTSGTTGPPKGAMNTHANVLSVVHNYGRWADLGPSDAVLAIAPFFHITGAVVTCAVSLVAGCNLVLIGRFHPEVALEAFKEHRVTNSVGAITAFNAMMQVPWASKEHFASVRLLFSGGAPVPPATVADFEQRFGHYIHNAYGMTETSSGVIAVPPGARAPVEPQTGSLSIGVALPGLEVRIVDPEGKPLPPGTVGELEISGPAIVPGYWRKPEATKSTMPGGRLRTGDGAIMDADGWVFLVDRIKDQINVSGYKVWPREVEDVLYEHPAVREAAVVGQPDAYRGETVAAYVSLRQGQTVTPEELVAFARERLAAYKVPRIVQVIEDLPKTQTGKIRRNVLRDQGQGAS